jgi:hypothetical protein
MTNKPVSKYRLSFKPPVLPTESQEDFDKLYSAAEQLFKPENIFDEMLLNDFVTSAWEQMRFQRCKPALLATDYWSAVKRVFSRLGINDSKKLEQFADHWLASNEGKEEVRKALAVVSLDETAIEAAALTIREKDYEIFTRLESTSGTRRDRSLRTNLELRPLLRKLKSDEPTEPSTAEEVPQPKSEAA